MAAISAARSSSALAATIALSRPNAFSRFCSWLRSSCELATRPVGSWIRRTADDVLLTCWPPAPEARNTSMRISASLSSTSGASITGHTCTAAKLVWRRPWLSNGLIRTSRCIPRSPVNRPYAYRPLIVASADRMPASVPSEVPSTVIAKPRRSAHLPYMRNKISLKSWASTPPSLALICRIASASSCSPMNRLRSSSWSRRRPRSSMIAAISGSCDSSSSSRARSWSTSTSSSVDASPSNVVTSSRRLAYSPEIAFAFSGSSQRSGRAMSASSSSSRPRASPTRR